MTLTESTYELWQDGVCVAKTFAQLSFGETSLGSLRTAIVWIK